MTRGNYLSNWTCKRQRFAGEGVLKIAFAGNSDRRTAGSYRAVLPR